MNTRTPYLEHCPNCRPAVRCYPRRLTPSGPDGVRAWYRCANCLYSWWTGWAREHANADREDA